jgi:hypothetical protein
VEGETPGDFTGIAKYSRADDPAHHDHRRVEQAEAPSGFSRPVGK